MLAKQPPSAAFPSPCGSGAFGGGIKDWGAFGGGKEKEKKNRVVLKLPQGYEDSEYVLSFEIGQREGGFYRTRTDGQTHPVRY